MKISKEESQYIEDDPEYQKVIKHQTPEVTDFSYNIKEAIEIIKNLEKNCFGTLSMRLTKEHKVEKILAKI